MLVIVGAAALCLLGLLTWWVVRNGQSHDAQLRRLAKAPAGDLLQSRMRAVLAICLVEDAAAVRLDAAARALGSANAPTGDRTGEEAVDQALRELATEAHAFRDTTDRLASDAEWIEETLWLADLPGTLAPSARRVLNGDNDGLEQFSAEVMAGLATAREATPLEARGPGPQGFLDETRATARSLADPSDRHADDRAKLDAALEDLGLLDRASKLSAKGRYRRLAREYEPRLARTVETFVIDAEREVTRTRAALATELGGAPRLERFAAAALRDAHDRLAEATTTYIQSCEQLLLEPHSTRGSQSSAAALEAQLSEARGALGSAHTQTLEDLLGIDVRLPAAWEPADRYRAASQATLDALTPVVAAYRDELRAWLRRAWEGFESADDSLRRAIAEAGNQSDARRERLWSELDGAAAELKDEVVVALAQSLEASDRGLPVRAAVALATVEDAAAVRLGAAAWDLLPEPEAPAEDAKTVEDHLGTVEKLLDSVERHSVAWAGTNAVLIQALDPDGNAGAMLTGSLFGVASVPEHLGRAGGDVFDYLHSGFPSDVGASIHEFIHSAVQNLTPGSAVAALPPHETGLLGTYHVAMAMKNSLAADFLSDDPIAKYFTSQGEHTAVFLGHRAAESPQFHDAAAQVAQAGHITAADAVHLLGHVPVVTMVISTTREFRLRRKQEVSASESIKNVALDVGAVGAGLGTAAGAGALLGIHGGPLVLLTVPGAVVGRLAANGIRKRRIGKLVDQYNILRGQYEQELVGLSGEFSQAVAQAVQKRRRLLIRAVGAPPRLQQCSDMQLRQAASALTAATTSYVDRAERLIASLPAAPTSELTTRLAAVHDGLKQSGQHLAADRFAEALLSLTVPGLPVAAAWSPAKDYAIACEVSAQHVTAVADDFRRVMADWMKDVGERFQAAKLALAKNVDEAHRSWSRKQDLAAAPLVTVQKALETELARA